MNEDELNKLTNSIFRQHKNTVVTVPALVLHGFIMSALTASRIDGISEETKMAYIDLAAQAGLHLTNIIPELREVYDNIPLRL